MQRHGLVVMSRRVSVDPRFHAAGYGIGLHAQFVMLWSIFDVNLVCQHMLQEMSHVVIELTQMLLCQILLMLARAQCKRETTSTIYNLSGSGCREADI